jgi:SNF2-related domain
MIMSSTTRLYIPRPYQGLAENFLAARERASLYAEPGLGKTAVMLSLVDRLSLDCVLVVAPRLVVRDAWTMEPLAWRDFQHLHVASLADRAPVERAQQLTPLRRITAVNPESLVWLIEHFGDAWPFTTVIWDESDKLAGFRLRQGSVRAAAMSQLAFTRVRRWYNLSGTPNANSYLDLWGPQWFIDGGEALGRTYSAYEQRWFRRPPHGSRYSPLELLPGAEAQIQARIKPTAYTVVAADWLPLHQMVETTLHFELPLAARRIYNDMRRTFVAELDDGEVSAANAAIKLGKLRQIASGRVYAEQDDDRSYGAVEVHTTRTELLSTLVHELQGAPLLVVYQWKHELEALKGWNRAARELREPGALEAWNAGEVAVMAIHPASGGHGLNLQHGGHHICFYSPLSDNRAYSQVVERLGPTRQLQAGYNRLVYVYHLEADRTVDQHTRAVREGRKTVLSAFLDALKA